MANTPFVLEQNNQYREAYVSMMEKGFITEEEDAELRALEKKHLQDKGARAERQSYYFSRLATFMALLFFLTAITFFINPIKNMGYLVSLITFFTAIVIAGSLFQSVFWSIIVLFGSAVGRRVYLFKRDEF